MRVPVFPLVAAVRMALSPGWATVGAALLAIGLSHLASSAIAGPFSGEFELSSMAVVDSSTGFVFVRIHGDGLCRGLVAARDANGDGIDDLIMGAEVVSEDRFSIS